MERGKCEFKSCRGQTDTHMKLIHDAGRQRVNSCSLRHLLNIPPLSSMQTEQSSHSTSFSMRGTQTISTSQPLPDPIPTYKPNQPDSYYPPALNLFERIWHDRYQFFLQKGFKLRPRYSPGWTPSRLNAKGESVLREDSLEHLVRPCFQI